MTLSILLLIIGLALVVFGADWLVDGASCIARKLGVSEFVIGLTIVGFGTSCPELVVSLTGAIQGNADISIGNVIGSNIFNTLLILGITATIFPILVTKSNRRVDIPIVLLVSLLFVGVSVFDKSIGLVDGLLFLAIFAAYIFYCFKFDTSASGTSEGSQPKVQKLWVAILLSLLGLAGLIIGGQLFVDNAVLIARATGVSDKFIAITLLAGGTSLPELVTCIVASAKRKSQLALGNILGSNVFNILFVLGLSSIVTPLSTVSIAIYDYAALLISAVLIWLWTFTGRSDKMDRWEGILLLVFYVSYMVVLFLKM